MTDKDESPFIYNLIAGFVSIGLAYLVHSFVLSNFDSLSALSKAMFSILVYAASMTIYHRYLVPRLKTD